MSAQTLTSGAPTTRPAAQDAAISVSTSAAVDEKQAVQTVQATPAASSAIPDDPGQEALPVAQPEPEAESGQPIRWEAGRQSRQGDDWTLEGGVVVRFRDVELSADRVVYHPSPTLLEAEGHLVMKGGTRDVVIHADRGDLRLNMHTARFFQVSGTMGVRGVGRSTVYTTMNPFRFEGRVLLQVGEGQYRIIDGRMTNCQLPHPDWQIVSSEIELNDGVASTHGAHFNLLGVPILWLPYLRHPAAMYSFESEGRESGLLIPMVSNSTVKGVIVGEQVYWVLGRSADLVVGAEYYSKRGWAPNGDFRWRGSDLDHVTVRWNALVDRGVWEVPTITTGKAAGLPTLVNQGGADISSAVRMDFSRETRLAGNVNYLSSYVYRLVFNDNISQAVSSQVSSDLALSHTHRGTVAVVEASRFQVFASSDKGNEARLLHIPSLRFDALDRPLGEAGLYGGFGASLGFLNRAEPSFHGRNLGRLDVYPHLSWPMHVDGWSLLPEFAMRNTFYSSSQKPNLKPGGTGIPTIRHELVDRADIEASVNVRPPAVERDFTFAGWNRVLRHVIEPELNYRFVDGVGQKARNIIRVDAADIVADTNEAEAAVTQRFYLRPIHPRPCADAPSACPEPQREWASWRIAQRVYIDPHFGGALIESRRNVFDSTLDWSGVAFLTSGRNLAPLLSRLRFEAIPNLRIEWDTDYDPKLGHMSADNIYAGYSWGESTIGIGHALLNAVDEKGSVASVIQSQQIQPFFTFGKPTRAGFSLATNAGYDFTLSQLQYAGTQASYNWNCCGLTVGYRRYVLGTQRDETQYLYSFTIASFGSVGDIRRSNSVFRDPSLPPAY